MANFLSEIFRLKEVNKEIQDNMATATRELATLKEQLAQLDKERDFVIQLHAHLMNISVFVGVMESK